MNESISPPGTATATITTDHDLLIRLDEKMNVVISNQALAVAEQGKLEARIRMLENFRYFVLGGAALLGFLAGLIAKYIFK